MWAASGTKLLSMNDAVSSSLYDSASSRAHAPQAGAALKSISSGFFEMLASVSAASASFDQCTFMISSIDREDSRKKAQKAQKFVLIFVPFVPFVA
jgi:hypothetical protein